VGPITTMLVAFFHFQQSDCGIAGVTLRDSSAAQGLQQSGTLKSSPITQAIATHGFATISEPASWLDALFSQECWSPTLYGLFAAGSE
jgi:hypothetical protein